MNLTQQAVKGDRASELLNGEIFSEAVENVRKAIIDKWQACPVRDKEGQHELHLMVKLLDELVGQINVFINEGKNARFQIESQKKREEQERKIRLATGGR